MGTVGARVETRLVQHYRSRPECSVMWEVFSKSHLVELISVLGEIRQLF
jgi:hypothetical protein